MIRKNETSDLRAEATMLVKEMPAPMLAQFLDAGLKAACSEEPKRLSPTESLIHQAETIDIQTLADQLQVLLAPVSKEIVICLAADPREGEFASLASPGLNRLDPQRRQKLLRSAHMLIERLEAQSGA